MFIAEMFTEASQPNIVVIYPGRFQPFHLGHRDVFESLQAKYGRDSVYIATSNKTELPKSPFNFTDKTILMHAAGVPGDRILEVKSPYILPPNFDPASTVFIVAVGAPDADRLKPGTFKKDGSESYYQPFKSVGECQTADKHGYVIIAAERKKVITINGQQYDASHGTENRALWNSIRNDEQARKEYLVQMYGRNDPEVGRILDKIPQTGSVDDASADPAIREHIIKHGSKYRLVSKHGNKNLGTFPTKAAAEKHEREVQYFKHANENAVPQWTDLGEELTMEDKMSIVESYYANGALLESDEHIIEYFRGLSRLAATPEKNKKYIVTPLLLIQNSVRLLNTSLIVATFVGEQGSARFFITDNGTEISFPNNKSSRQGTYYAFMFDNTKAYNDFRSELALKFNVELPAADSFGPSEQVEEGQGTSVKAWAMQVRTDHGNDVKFTNDKHGGGTVNRAIARNSQGETVGVFNRNTGDATVFEPTQGVVEGEAEALQYATTAHAGQTRAGGDPYITHPMRVAEHIRQFKQSHNLEALISAAYLHDTVEDTDTTQEVLHDLFGGLVASLVQELTSDPAQIKKLGKAVYLSHKMAAMSSYALVIKLADRLDNVKDITTAKTPEWRAKYAAETNQILNYIEKTRALSGTHQKLISLIRAKLAEINQVQPVAEDKAYSDATQKLRGLSFIELDTLAESAGANYNKFNAAIMKNLNLPKWTNTLEIYGVYVRHLGEAKTGKLILEGEHPTVEQELFNELSQRTIGSIDSAAVGDKVSLLHLVTLDIPGHKVVAKLNGFLTPKEITKITNNGQSQQLEFVDGSIYPEKDGGDVFQVTQGWNMTKLFPTRDAASKSYMMYALIGKKLSNTLDFNIAVDQGISEDAAGVGVVSNSKDPRYVSATTGDQNDVTASTLAKMMTAYGLTGRKAPK